MFENTINRHHTSIVINDTKTIMVFKFSIFYFNYIFIIDVMPFDIIIKNLFCLNFCQNGFVFCDILPPPTLTLRGGGFSLKYSSLYSINELSPRKSSFSKRKIKLCHPERKRRIFVTKVSRRQRFSSE